MNTYIHAYIHAYTATYMRQCNAHHHKHKDKILNKQKEDRQPPEHRAPHARTNIVNLLSHGADHSNQVKQSTINNYERRSANGVHVQPSHILMLLETLAGTDFQV